MKALLILLAIFGVIACQAQTNSIHDWTLQNGKIISGDFVSSGTQMVVIKTEGTNCLIKINDLSTNDFIYLYEYKMKLRQMQLDAEAAQMKAAGKMEFTSKFLEDFPEKAMNRLGWIDGTFEDTSAIGIDGADKDYFLGFWIKDKSNNAFDDMVVFKKNPHNDQPTPELAEVMQLKHGDRVRFFGCPQEKVEGSGDRDLRFYISHVEMIELKMDADRIKELKEADEPWPHLPK